MYSVMTVACLSYTSVTGHLDPSVMSGAVFNDAVKMTSEAINLLSNEKYRKNHILRTNTVFKECGLDDNWANKLAVIMSSHQKRLSRKVFANQPPKRLTDLDVFIAKYLMTQRIIFKFGSFLRLVTWKYNSKRFFGINFLHFQFYFSL